MTLLSVLDFVFVPTEIFALSTKSCSIMLFSDVGMSLFVSLKVELARALLAYQRPCYPVA